MTTRARAAVATVIPIASHSRYHDHDEHVREHVREIERRRRVAVIDAWLAWLRMGYAEHVAWVTEKRRSGRSERARSRRIAARAASRPT